MKKGIVLCGFMGAGKSKLGQLLSGMIGYRFEDLDEEIQKYESKTIAEIFSEVGETGFRSLEQHYLSQKIADANRVLSLGGGAMQSQSTVDAIKAKNLLVYLSPPFDEIIIRLMGSTKRPMLLKPDGSQKNVDELRSEIRTLMDKRTPFYEQAHITFRPDPEWSPMRSTTNLLQSIKSHEYEV